MSMKKYLGHCVGQVGVRKKKFITSSSRLVINSRLDSSLRLVIRVTRNITQVLRFTDYELRSHNGRLHRYSECLHYYKHVEKRGRFNNVALRESINSEISYHQLIPSPMSSSDESDYEDESEVYEKTSSGPLRKRKSSKHFPTSYRRKIGTRHSLNISNDRSGDMVASRRRKTPVSSFFFLYIREMMLMMMTSLLNMFLIRSRKSLEMTSF